jgi:hypothetical protein
MKRTLTVLLAVFTMLLTVSCMERTNTGYGTNNNPNVEPTPGTVDSLDYLE